MKYLFEQGLIRTSRLRAVAAAAACLCLAASPGCRRSGPGDDASPPPLDPGRFTGPEAYAEVVDFVSLGPRDAGTAGAHRAANYLAGRLRALGLDPLIDEFQDETPTGPATFRNVAAVLTGRQRETVILASHYDTKAGIDPAFAGANDSGSSTGLLLALAPHLREAAPALPFDIVLAFFDGEECRLRYGPRDGLHGSRHMARTLVRNQRAGRVRAMILLDMVGDRDLRLTIPRNSTPALVKLAFDSARTLGVRQHLTLAPGEILDDHVPFLEAGMPAIDLIDFQYGSRPGANDYWHTAQDTLDKIDPASLEIVGRLVMEMLNGLANDT